MKSPQGVRWMVVIMHYSTLSVLSVGVGTGSTVAQAKILRTPTVLAQRATEHSLVAGGTPPQPYAGNFCQNPPPKRSERESLLSVLQQSQEVNDLSADPSVRPLQFPVFFFSSFLQTQ